MQKKNPKAAQRAKAGDTGSAGKAGKAGKTGKTGKNRGAAAGDAGVAAGTAIKQDPRWAKRLRDRKYRARKRAAERLATAGGCGKCPHHGHTEPLGSPDVFGIIGRLVVGELAGSCAPQSAACSRLERPEPGVVRQEVVLPDGSRARVVLVDGDEVDPLSPNSPVPWPIRRHLLLRRMAREISDIVDAHRDLS